MPSESSNDDIITVVGKKADCEKARAMIREIESKEVGLRNIQIFICCNFSDYCKPSLNKVVNVVSKL